MTDVLRIHQYTDSPTGHVNIEFIHDGVSQGIYGATPDGLNGFGLDGGVFEQTASSLQRISTNPGQHTYTDIAVGSQQYSSAYNFATGQYLSTSIGYGDYDLIGQNCISFAGDVFMYAGIGEHTVSDYLLQQYSMTYAYAAISDFLADPFNYGYITNLSIDPMIYGGVVNQWTWDTYGTDLGSFNFDNYTYNTIVLGASTMATIELLMGSSEELAEAQEVAEEFSYQASPIAIDLNGDGVRTQSLNDSSIHFDITGDGLVERTGWLSSEDGFIAFDADGNGLIDDVNELFGGLGRGDGYRELRAFDSNGDGLLTGDDAQFNELSVWRDVNSNGQTENGELSFLLDTAITQISLDYISPNRRDNGNLIGESSEAIINGLNVEVADIYFRYKPLEIDSPAGRGFDVQRSAFQLATTNSAVENVISTGLQISGCVEQMISAMAQFDSPQGSCISTFNASENLTSIMLAVA